MKLLQKIKIWWLAHTTETPYWRVTYPTGETTRLLSFQDAEIYAYCFGGTMWIDYDFLLDTNQ